MKYLSLKLFFLLSMSVCFNLQLQAKPKKGQALIDSLEADLKNARTDSLKCHLLTRICYAYGTIDAEKGIDYGNKAFELAQKTGSKRAIAEALYFRGFCYIYSSRYPNALDDFLAALPIFEELGINDRVAGLLSNIGGVYIYQTKYDLALNYLERALKLNRLDEKENDNFEAANLANIGEIYFLQHDMANALRYYNEAYTICEKGHHADMLPAVVVSLSTIYLDQKNNGAALHFANRAMNLAVSTGDRNVIANAYLHLGEAIYQAVEANDKAILDSLQKAGITKPLQVAHDYLDSAIRISNEVGSLNLMTNAYQKASALEELRGNYPLSLDLYKKYKQYNDSMYNDKNKEKILQSTMEHEFEIREIRRKEDQMKKDIQQRNIRNSILAGFSGTLIFLAVVYRQRNKIARARKRSDELLLNILPQEVAEELKLKGEAEAKLIEEVSVLFTDFKGFTAMSEMLTPKELVRDLHECFTVFDNIIQKHGLEKIKTIGDAYMAAGGLPTPNSTHASDVVKAALEIKQFMEEGKAKKIARNQPFFEIRIGVHTGPVVAGIVGVKKFSYDIWGDTVNTASRMESSGETGKVNISGTTYERVKDQFQCIHRGKIQAKGKGELDMYFVESRIDADTTATNTL